MKSTQTLCLALTMLATGSAFAAQPIPPGLQKLAQETAVIAHTPDAQQREKLLQTYIADLKTYADQYQKMMSTMNMGGH